MVKFLIWLVLLVVAWPLALAALVLYPVLWLLLLPLRLVWGLVTGVLKLVAGFVGLALRAARSA